MLRVEERSGPRWRGFPFRTVVAAKPVVGPGGSSPQALILDDRRVLQQRLLAAVVFQPLVGAQPDAIAVAIHLAAAFARAAARTVALVFRALRFRTEICDVRQRAVAAILAAGTTRPCSISPATRNGSGPCNGSLEFAQTFRAPFGKRRARREHRLMRPLGQLVNRRDVL